jgi:hypothetical protein
VSGLFSPEGQGDLMSNDLERIWEEDVTAQFEALSGNLLGGTDYTSQKFYPFTKPARYVERDYIVAYRTVAKNYREINNYTTAVPKKRLRKQAYLHGNNCTATK